MNERIRDLAEQAGAGWDHKYHWYVGSETMQKFAELIVRECADIASINQHQYHSVGKYVLKHFGVEE